MDNTYAASIALWDPKTRIIGKPGYCPEGTQSGLDIGNITITFPGSVHQISHAQKAALARQIATQANKIARHYEGLASRELTPA